MMPKPPLFPAGEFDQVALIDDSHKSLLIKKIGSAPERLRSALEGLSDTQLNTPYRNWTIRQIVHHLADSHMHSYIRFKWALTENDPMIKAYDESAWSELEDARTSEIEPSLQLLEGLHRRWVTVLQTMTRSDYDRSFQHPETGEVIQLSLAIAYYAWHGRHHTAQIMWVRGYRL